MPITKALNLLFRWSPTGGLNTEPPDYKSGALPIELAGDMAPRLGLEPRTFRLTAECSTIELTGQVMIASGAVHDSIS